MATVFGCLELTHLRTGANWFPILLVTQSQVEQQLEKQQQTRGSADDHRDSPLSGVDSNRIDSVSDTVPQEKVQGDSLELTEEELEQELPIGDLPIGDLPIGDDTESEQSSEQAIASDTIDLPVFGVTKVSEVGMPLFTIAVGLVDGFNPCAMWVLLFLLSILVNLKSRVRMLLVAGTFVLISGIAYFLFMAAWLQVFMLIGLLRPIQIALGVLAIGVGAIHVKDFFAFKKGVSLSIPESAKPGIYRRVRAIINAEHLGGALITAAVLAVMVNVIELLCTAGLPALYTEVLILQGFSPALNYAYLGLYIIAYMFDDALMVLVVTWTLSKKKMDETEGRWLKLVSGLVILLLGFVMIFFPSWLL